MRGVLGRLGTKMLVTGCVCTPCPVLDITALSVPILKTSQIILLGSWRNCLNNKIVLLKLVPLKKMISLRRRNYYANLYMWGVCVCMYIHCNIVKIFLKITILSLDVIWIREIGS